MGPDLPVGNGGDDVLTGLSLVLPVIPLGEVLGDLIARESGELGGFLCAQSGRAVHRAELVAVEDARDRLRLLAALFGERQIRG